MCDLQPEGIEAGLAPSGESGAVVVVGGFAGLCMLHRLRGLGFSARVFEEGSGVGGTWFWNRYPGAGCDVPSMEYSYQFSEELEQEWDLWGTVRLAAGDPAVLEPRRRSLRSPPRHPAPHADQVRHLRRRSVSSFAATARASVAGSSFRPQPPNSPTAPVQAWAPATTGACSAPALQSSRRRTADVRRVSNARAPRCACAVALQASSSAVQPSRSARSSARS